MLSFVTPGQLVIFECQHSSFANLLAENQTEAGP
jgi:hypothetical protein